MGRKGIVKAEFDKMRMRQLLLNCLEIWKSCLFSKFRRRLKLKREKFHVLDGTISVDCATDCGLPNTYNDMIQCEMSGCSRWFHYKCVDISRVSGSLLWDCDSSKEKYKSL